MDGEKHRYYITADLHISRSSFSQCGKMELADRRGLCPTWEATYSLSRRATDSYPS